MNTQKIMNLLNQGHKIKAIKLLRLNLSTQDHNATIKDCKAIIDLIMELQTSPENAILKAIPDIAINQIYTAAYKALTAAEKADFIAQLSDEIGELFRESLIGFYMERNK